MKESKLATELKQIYLVAEDSNIIFKQVNQKQEISLGFLFKNSKINSNSNQLLNGIDYLNLETLHNLEKVRKIQENSIYKKLNKERLTTIFKCLGFNIIYCPTIAENIFNDLHALVNLKYKENEINDCIKSSIVIKQNIFYDIAKNVISNLTGTRCSFKKYFNLSCLIISNK
jgi:hypothetical protein